MIVRRHEKNTLRIAEDGSLTIPADTLCALLAPQDMSMFGPGAIVRVVAIGTDDGGTGVLIERDRRQEAVCGD